MVRDSGQVIASLHGVSISLRPQEAGAPIPAREGFLQWGDHTAPPNGPQIRLSAEHQDIAHRTWQKLRFILSK